MHTQEQIEHEMIAGQQPESGIYFLYGGGNVIYIGISSNIPQIVAQKKNKINFDHYTYIPCRITDGSTCKAVGYIFEYQPEENANLPVNKCVISAEKLFNTKKVNKTIAKAWVKWGWLEVYKFKGIAYVYVSEVNRILKDEYENKSA